MVLRLRSEQQEIAYRACREAAPVNATPREACGLIIGTYAKRSGGILGDLTVALVEELTVEENVSANPEHEYEISRGAVTDRMIQAAGGGFEIVGAWHSHPLGPYGLSGSDVAAAPDLDDYVHLLLLPLGVHAYRVETGRFDERRLIEVPIEYHGGGDVV